MATSFFPLPVKAIEKTTDECSVVSFEVSDELKQDFLFSHGQYLTLRAKIDGQDVRRSYSLCSSPLDGEWKVAVKKIEGGLFSTYVNDVLQAGDIVEAMPPNGRFFKEIEADQQKHYVAFAAGSGITPIFSIIKTHLHAEPASTFRLFYVNQHVGSIILKEEIEALKNQFLNRFEIYHFLTQEERSSPLFDGRLSEEKLDVIFSRIVDAGEIDDYFICGPEEMIFMIRDDLIGRGVGEKQIHFELFASGKKNGKAVSVAPEKKGKMCELSIREGGKSSSFELPIGSNNILDAALQKSADLPFACKGGVCCTCRAKLVEGEVQMQVNYALEQEEIDAGYILTCQAIPLSEKVVVDFDA